MRSRCTIFPIAAASIPPRAICARAIPPYFLLYRDYEAILHTQQQLVLTLWRLLECTCMCLYHRARDHSSHDELCFICQMSEAGCSSKEASQSRLLEFPSLHFLFCYPYLNVILNVFEADAESRYAFAILYIFLICRACRALTLTCYSDSLACLARSWWDVA